MAWRPFGDRLGAPPGPRLVVQGGQAQLVGLGLGGGLSRFSGGDAWRRPENGTVPFGGGRNRHGSCGWRRGRGRWLLEEPFDQHRREKSLRDELLGEDLGGRRAFGLLQLAADALDQVGRQEVLFLKDDEELFGGDHARNWPR